jgi:glycine/D-amino acid oxidase-like deaminating enzyme
MGYKSQAPDAGVAPRWHARSMRPVVTPMQPDVVVVGGGVIGLSIAWEAAAAGMSVTLADPQPGRGAGWAAAGMLAPAGEAHFGEDALTMLNVVAARAWPSFAHTLQESSGRSVHYVDDGTLLIAVDASDRAASDDLLAHQLALGLEARRLSAAECRTAEPLLAPGIRGGADLSEDHQVDNRSVLEALVVACAVEGVTVVEEEVSRVEVQDGCVTGVVLADGRRCQAGAVVVAAGSHSGQLPGIPDPFLPPVRPVKGLTLRLRAGAGVPTLARTTTGLRPGSPDNAPIVGVAGLGGLLMATGHYRNGFLLAPLTADEVVRLLGETLNGRELNGRELNGRELDGRELNGRESADTGWPGRFSPFTPSRFVPAAQTSATGSSKVRTPPLHAPDVSGVSR